MLSWKGGECRGSGVSICFASPLDGGCHRAHEEGSCTVFVRSGKERRVPQKPRASPPDAYVRGSVKAERLRLSQHCLLWEHRKSKQVGL